ncbi:MAG: 4Fe-4S binding protein [Deltaproteobacteria bacterium]|nr:4Fe-4S binding protein [Deltaproteobacteria bacterium]MBW2116791.1 4Fe-4S binding protein [Deltaproteobacteria bacterium]MBW2345025.1 4Fe-4S binding protein [Deltaproteobacteria bacterium]
MKIMRKIIKIDEELCDGCGQCVPGCAEGAIEIIDGKARLVSESYCDGLGACLGECPNGAITIEERKADDFDEEAVEAYLKEKPEKPVDVPLACACPSTQVQTFIPKASEQDWVADGLQPGAGSTLSHWPVQINLVPPIAPFLKGADLLIAADCTPLAYPNFHRDFLKGKVVMIGCPKFDDVEEYILKFTKIFKVAGIKSITALIMEVPCCSGLPMIVKRAMDAAGKDIPMEEIVISTRGDILKREQKVAA